MKPLLKKSTLVIVVIFLIIIAALQVKHDHLSPPFSFKIKVVRRDLLPQKVLPYISFGFNAIFADYYWIRSIQDFVGWDHKDEFFINYIKNITTLDPRFEYPYLFGILVIPQNKDVGTLDKLSKLVDERLEYIPTSWKVPYYLGTQYYLFTKTYERAEKYLAIAASTKNAPPGVYLNYSSFVAKKIQGHQASTELIKVIYTNTDNEVIKKLTEKGLQESIVSQMLEKGILAYKVKFGRYPKTIEELQNERFISLPEELKDTFVITINQKSGAFSLKLKK